MNPNNEPSHFNYLHKRAWIGLFALSAIEGVAALVAVASLPADAENALVLGLSARRLALMAVLLAASLACAVLAWARARLGGRDGWLSPAARRGLMNALFIALPLGAVFSALLPSVLFNLYRTSGSFTYYAYYERLLPLLAWLGLFCLQGTAWLAWAGDFRWSALGSRQTVYRAAALVFGLLLGLWALVGLSGLGITPDPIGWGKPAVPLLEWQIWSVLVVGTGFLLFLAYRRWPARRDLWLAAAIWLLAAGLWLGQPVHTAFFATAGRPPNNEIYPFSDGAYYGLFAQNLLIGNGFKGNEVPPRPFYITLLAGFHALAGQSYEQVIFVQTLLLAFFPVVLYFIGKELHSRPLGLMLSLLAILRELTAMITSPITASASTSQMFFADLPAALAISLWALLALIWIKAPGRRPLLPLLVGGSLGLAMLIRTQSVFMLPVVLLAALLAQGARWRAWLGQVVLVLAGVTLMIAPWLGRNVQATGQLAFDDPKSQTAEVARRYNLEEYNLSSGYIMRPDENLQDFSARVNQGIFTYLLANPGEVAFFIGNHLLNAEIGNLLLLPVRDKLPAPADLVMPGYAFWQSWDGAPSPGQALLILLNLGVLALGIGAAWVRRRWAGLALLLMGLSYNASHAIARNSGLRYLLPVDWMTYTYAAAGLLELALAVLLVLGLPVGRLETALNPQEEAQPEPRPLRPSRKLISSGALLGLGLLLVGSLPVMAEHVFPRRYPFQTQAALANEVLQTPSVQASPIDASTLGAFMRQPGVQIVKGRALYPRFYAAGDGEPRTAKIGYEPLDFARSLFLVASNTYNGLVMLRAEQPPDHLPNAADVIVVGCAGAGHIDARLVLVLDPPGSVYLAGAGIPVGCEAEDAGRR